MAPQTNSYLQCQVVRTASQGLQSPFIDVVEKDLEKNASTNFAAAS